MTARQPSSTTAGFFQQLPVIPPAYTSSTQKQSVKNSDDDAVLRNILNLYLPSPCPPEVDQSLHDLARTCLDPSTLRLTVDCEVNQPTLHLLGTFGGVNAVSPLRTGEGWRGLKDIQTRVGVVALGYRGFGEGESAATTAGLGSTPGKYNLRVHQFALAHMWSASSAAVSCPAAMTDGAAILLSRHLARSQPSVTSAQDAGVLRKVLEQAYARLTSFDPGYAWTSGQWMTERPGGSDVSRTETLARLGSEEELKADENTFASAADSVDMPLGPWFIDGFKWFSSATDADMVVLLAQTQKGLSAFYAPMKRTVVGVGGKRTPVMNGVCISRLKNKMGTKGLPTAELEIKGMRGWLLGEEGRGVREISAILNATRLWTAVGATGSWGRGLAVAKAYCQVRKIKGEQVLAENRQHVRWLAEEAVKYRAATHLAFLGVALLGISEWGVEVAAKGTRAGEWLPRDKQEAEILLRILTPVMKAQCSLAATLGLRECMESLGGVGYCENNEDDGLMNIARLLRDSSVNSIWEGTSNILAEDFVRATRGQVGGRAIEALGTMLDKMLEVASLRFAEHVETIKQTWHDLRTFLTTKKEVEALYRGKGLLRSMEDIVCAALLLVDACCTQGEVERVIADRWLASRISKKKHLLSDTSALTESEIDKQILFGSSAIRAVRRDSKL
ncbi:hypothetical protein LTR51_000654 [Lithohypha guttulata]|nr:hypothetical protein LTR51_000654 [Lithohypha guttulata]